MLPIDDAGEPDWQFMEDYIREREAVQVERCREFLARRLEEIERVTEPVIPLDEKVWMPFPLASIGRISSGRDIYAQEREAGRTPYITSGSANNGIGYFVNNMNDKIDSGYIALNRNGAVGKAFYHPYPSLMGNDCRKLHLKEADNNEFVGMFVTVAISMQSACFSYSRKLGTKRAERLQVMLPMNDEGEPDYDYMENYVHSIMEQQYRRELRFLERKCDLIKDGRPLSTR
ncbi:restriction endonuclease subunit S [Bifidobacterium callitrichidarum]|nr:restriction endonuclease subunit S [Bifidobacterium callitrichidarum]